jgi:hypothetical protein
MQCPLINANITLLTSVEHPRTVPDWRPTVSTSIARTNDSEHSAIPLGITFTSSPSQLQPGNTVNCSFRILAWAAPFLELFVAGVEFAILEGTTVVGSGMIIAVEHPSDA